MKKNFVITQEDFDGLLNWFSADRDQAGRIYEDIRGGLIRFFHFRGCHDPEILADETINRVATKVSTFDSGIKAVTYFYGFAANIHREHLSKRSRQELQLEEESYFGAEDPPEPGEEEDVRLQCLDSCLEKLPSPESELVLQYYSREKKEKMTLRSELAKSMNLKVNTLYLRIHRLKSTLRDCVEKCQEERA